MSQRKLTFPLIVAIGVSPLQEWEGGYGEFMAYGTPGGSTIALEMSPDGGTTFIPVLMPNGGAACSHAANGSKPFDMPRCQLRVNVAGGAGMSWNSLAVRTDTKRS